MNAFVNIAGYFALSITTTAILFELMHWPAAGIMLVTGIACINFVFLPAYFYQRYKRQL